MGPTVGFEQLILPAATAGALGTAAAVLSWVVYTRFYVRPPPNRAVVLYGRTTPHAGSGRGAPTPTAEIRPPRIVVGGRVFVPPWNHSFGFLSLAPLDIDLAVRAVRATGGAAATGWEARLGAQVKIPADPTLLASAAENLLGKSADEVRALVRSAIEGAVPAILTRHGPGDAEPDWERLGSEIQAAVAADLVAVGLVVQALSVKQLLRINSGTAAAPPHPGTAPTTRAPELSPDADEPPSAAVDLRLSRLERSVGVLGAQIDRVVQGAVVPGGRPLAAVRTDAPGLPSGGDADADPVLRPGRATVHDSIGGGSPPDARTPTRSGPASGVRGGPRSLLDTEPER